MKAVEHPVAGVDYPSTFQALDEWFRDEVACRAYIRRLRWPTGFCCPDCGVVGEPWEMAGGWLRCRACRRETSITAGTIFEGTRKPLRTWFLAMWFVTSQKNGMSALGLQRALGLGSYETSWTWLHKLRRAMVRPGRDRLAGEIEADETYVGGPEEGKRGRAVESKAIVAVAAEQRGRGIGRIRLRRVKDVSAESLLAFLQEAVEPGATIHTDGWRGYAGLPAAGYRHQVTVISGGSEPAHEVMPRVHKVAALLKRWWSGLSRAASSTNISTTTSTNSPSASIGVDHRPEASCSTASSSRRWPSTGPLPLHHHTQDIRQSPRIGGMKGILTWRKIGFRGLSGVPEGHAAPPLRKLRSVSHGASSCLNLPLPSGRPRKPPPICGEPNRRSRVGAARATDQPTS